MRLYTALQYKLAVVRMPTGQIEHDACIWHVISRLQHVSVPRVQATGRVKVQQRNAQAPVLSTRQSNLAHSLREGSVRKHVCLFSGR